MVHQDSYYFCSDRFAAQRVWLICKKCCEREDEENNGGDEEDDDFSDHIWQVKVCDVVSDPSLLVCPCCSNRKVARSNCLLTVRPDVSALWQVGGLNGDMTPEGVLAYSDAKVWLKKGDRCWEVVVRDVIEAQGLPEPPPLPLPPTPPPQPKPDEVEPLQSEVEETVEVEVEHKKEQCQEEEEVEETLGQVVPQDIASKKTMMKRFSGVLASMMRRKK